MSKVIETFESTGIREANFVRKSETLSECIVCGKLTKFVDSISEGRICSPRCLGQFYDKIVELSSGIGADLTYDRCVERA